MPEPLPPDPLPGGVAKLLILDVVDPGERGRKRIRCDVSIDGAQPGIIMPGRFLLGSKYFQEIAPGVAMDRGRNVGMGIEIDTPAGTFDGCVAVLDSTALDPDAEGDLKIYCHGIGIVMDEVLELVERGIVHGGG